MSPPVKRSLTLPLAGIVLLTLIAIFLAQNGVASFQRVPGWTWSSIRLKLALAQDASAGAYYERTARAPLALAAIVGAVVVMALGLVGTRKVSRTPPMRLLREG